MGVLCIILAYIVYLNTRKTLQQSCRTKLREKRIEADENPDNKDNTDPFQREGRIKIISFEV